MKNILLLSSVMIESEFASYQAKANVKPNPSNQNFYARLLKALSLTYNVSVISHRPFIKGMFHEKYLMSSMSIDGRNHFYYAHIGCSKGYKLFKEAKCIDDMVQSAIIDFNSDDFVVVVDVLRYGLLKAAVQGCGHCFCSALCSVCLHGLWS